MALVRLAASADPPYLPGHNGKVERYQRILANELLYARPWRNEAHRCDAIATRNLHYNHHRPHSAAADKPPASRLRTGVISNYT
ncbi:integrase core domain-containing protein [Nocardioides sp. LS1]|uniref:integrase core domain-containing protein n=1 Tax=Nocardioides sp. LS1 TaxID=1027620 RepID=UPI000F619356|nr:hypothetical protein NLS1_31440 [Nocardioides sp. LS1]